MTNHHRRIGLVQGVWILAGVLVIVAATWHIARLARGSTTRFTTPYQAVLLTNGNVYFGKLEDYGTRFPVLTDVFYVQSTTNSETKQTMNVLVKRGKELHAPDRMYLNPNQIILVEPVGPDSKVAQLIAEQKKQ
jgi:hypothetical protein